MSGLALKNRRYILLGYNIPSLEQNYPPQALLYDPEKKSFRLKDCKPTVGRHFRSYFPGFNPPLPYTVVEENILSGVIKNVETSKVRFSDIPHTVISTEVLMNKLCITSKWKRAKDGMKKEIQWWTQMSEKEFVLEHLFTPSFLLKIRMNVIRYFQFVKREHFYLPNNINQLFVAFEKVDLNKWLLGKDYEPDTVVMWQKIIKYIVEDVCPFVRVAILDNLDMEKALMICLPTGSKGKCKEIFFSDQVDYTAETEKYYSMGSVIVEANTYRVLENGVSDVPMSGNPKIETITSVPNELNWNSITVNRRGMLVDTKDDESFNRIDDPESRIALIANTYDSETSNFYKKQAVVFFAAVLKDVRTIPFSIFDFKNFYANVFINFDDDDFIIRVLTEMINLRDSVPGLKPWIVSLIGKMKHYDPNRYSRIKNLSVAIVLNTINQNCDIVCGATTDGIMIDMSRIYDLENITFAYPAGFPVNLEFMPCEENKVLIVKPSYYAAIDVNKNVVHRGFIGRMGGSHPAWYRDYLDIVIKNCLRCVYYGTMNIPNMIKKLNRLLQKKADHPSKYVLEDCGRLVPPVTEKLYAIEMYLNELNTGLNQYFTVIDDTVLPWNINAETLSTNPLPITLSGWCLKNVNVKKYIELMFDKLRRVAYAFEKYSDCLDVVNTAYDTFKSHIEETVTVDKGCYPGGVVVF